jgi:hypothetical protein
MLSLLSFFVLAGLCPRSSVEIVMQTWSWGPWTGCTITHLWRCMPWYALGEVEVEDHSRIWICCNIMTGKDVGVWELDRIHGLGKVHEGDYQHSGRYISICSFWSFLLFLVSYTFLSWFPVQFSQILNLERSNWPMHVLLDICRCSL